MAVRIQAVRMDFNILQRWITEGRSTSFDVVKGVPDGARFVDAEVDGQSVVLFYEHESFPEVNDFPGFRGYPELKLALRERHA